MEFVHEVSEGSEEALVISGYIDDLGLFPYIDFTLASLSFSLWVLVLPFFEPLQLLFFAFFFPKIG